MSKSDELLATIESLRGEINELKNRPDANAARIEKLEVDLKATRDELAAAKNQRGPEPEKKPAPAPAPQGEAKRERFGFW